MNRARKGDSGLDRLSVSRADKRAHKRKLASRRRDRADAIDAEREARLVALLEDGLVELATLRRRYGEHRDFDLVEAHQRSLIASLEPEGERA